MKALLATLILSLPLLAQENDPFGTPQPKKVPKFYQTVIPSIEVDDTSLTDVFAYLSSSVPDSPNVAFQGRAGDIRISLALKNVTLKNLIDVIAEITGTEIGLIDSNPNDEVPGVFVVYPSHNLVHAESGMDMDGGSFGGGFEAQQPENQAAVSRAYPLGKLSEETAISAITMMWESSEPAWAQNIGENSFRYHAASSLLIINAPEARQKEATDILQKIQPKKSEPQQELERLTQRFERADRESTEREHQLREELQKVTALLQEREIENVRMKVELEELAKRKKNP